MEKKFLAKPVYVFLYCEECNEAMEKTNTINGAYFAVDYVYTCPKCGKSIRSDKNYPYLEYLKTTTPVLGK